jgi:hypothetical protein
MTCRNVLKQVFRNGGVSGYLKTPFHPQPFRGKMVSRLTDEYVFTKDAKHAFKISGLNFGKEFTKEFGEYAVSKNKQHNSVEVHTDEHGLIKGLYLVI